MILKITISIIALLLSSMVLAQKSQKMEATETPNTYETSSAQKKPVQTSFKHSNNSAVVKIKESEFKKYPKKKRKAILAEPEKYTIVED